MSSRTMFSEEELYVLGLAFNALLAQNQVANFAQNKPSFEEFVQLTDDYRRKSIDVSKFPQEIKQTLQEYASQHEALTRKITFLRKELEYSNPTLARQDSIFQKSELIGQSVKDRNNKLSEEQTEIAYFEKQLGRLKQHRAELEQRIKQEKETNPRSNLSAPSLPPTELDWYEVIRLEDLQRPNSKGKTSNFEILHARRAGEKVLVKKIVNPKDFEVELSISGQIHSGYVLNMYGASMLSKILVFESAKRGNLYSLLLNQNISIVWSKRWDIARDIALAMHYLHSKLHPVLNRNTFLRCYNLYVTLDWRVKFFPIGGLLPAEFKSSGLTQQQFDMQWLAPELMRDGDYSEKSDCYSYAIICWQIANRAPFPFSPNEIESKLFSDERPAHSADCPEEFQKLIDWNWRTKPESRLNFRRIVKQFKDKGLLSNPEEKSKLAASKIEDVLRELDIQKQLVEKLEKQADQAERRLNREKQLTECCVQENQAVENRLELEVKKTTELQKKLDSLFRDQETTKQQLELSEKKSKKDSKNVDIRNKRILEDLLQEKELAEKKLMNEKKRGQEITSSLKEVEQNIETERNKRMEAERRRDELRNRLS